MLLTQLSQFPDSVSFSRPSPAFELSTALPSGGEGRCDSGDREESVVG